jgi:type VI secretion system secreted protein Hcp
MKRNRFVPWVAMAAMLLLPLGETQAQKNKKNKNKNQVIETPVEQATPLLGSGPVSFYVTIQGARQGNLKGQSSGASHTGQIAGVQFQMQMTVAHDAVSGKASGNHQYTQIVFTKQWDASSPQLFQAASSGELLPVVEFDFVRTAADGREYTFETIKLTEASITGIKDYIGYPNSGNASDGRALEEVSIAFQKIEISNIDGHTMAIDDWHAGL